ncbi:MAG: hypothetical protein K1X78_10180 [Verrucomicrobiaceae bacterium]|nr:hypothetical protein [Verrucomicrobiaceae bacterium]
MKQTGTCVFRSAKAPVSPFFSFFDGGTVVAVREAFDRSLDELPPAIGAQVSAFWKSRVRRSEGDPMLGEKLPIILGDLFQVSKDDTVALAIAWLHIYTAILIVDDILDEDLSIERGAFAIAAPLLVARGASLFSQNALYPKLIASRIEASLRACAAAAVDEPGFYRARGVKLIRQELAMASRKVSALDICTEAFAQASTLTKAHLKLKRREVVKMVDSIKIAFQLLDDITDLHDDWLRGHHTFPLRGLRPCEGRSRFDQKPDQFWLDVSGEPNLSKALSICIDAIERCRLSLKTLGRCNGAVSGYFDWLYQEVKTAHTQAVTLLELPSHRKDKTEIDIFRRQLIVIAQTT